VDGQLLAAGRGHDVLERGPEEGREADLPLQDVGAVEPVRLLDGHQVDLLRPHAGVERGAVGPHAVRHPQHVPRRGAELPGAGELPGDEVRRPEELRHERGGRALVELVGASALLHPAAVHHRDLVRHRHRLLLVVRDVDERDADLLLDAL